MYSVTEAQYKKVYDFCHPKQTPKYHIVYYNCATFAIKALEQAGIKHKFKRKFWNMGLLALPILGFGAASIMLLAMYYYGYNPAQMARDVITGKY